MEVKEIKKKLKKSLDKQRYQHTLGVMYTAGCLAMANGYSIAVSYTHLTLPTILLV